MKRITNILCLISILAVMMAAAGCGQNMRKQEPATQPAAENTSTAENTAIPGSTSAAETTAAALQTQKPDTEEDLIMALISTVPSQDPDKTASLMEQLQEQNTEEALAWERILKWWNDVNAAGFVNLDPDAPQPDTRHLNDAAPEEEVSSASGYRPVRLPENLPEDDSLCLVVLGYGLRDDGKMREELLLRLHAALDCAQQYPNAFVLVTGGGTAKNAPSATEADTMAAWLEEHGLEKTRLIIENRSRITCENAVFSYEILQKDYPQIHHLAIVTSEYHVPLGCLLFQTWCILQENAGITSAGEPAAGSGIRDLQVVANAACRTDRKNFSLLDQAKWLKVLLTYIK